MTDRKQWTIAVTGLNATDNPGPGISVIRALRQAPEFDGRIVGLAYDTLEPGIYAEDLVDDAFIIPYPSHGRGALEQRLRYIHDRVGGIDVIIPTLDAELNAFIALAPVLDELGIGHFLPTQEQLDLRSKAHLMELGEAADIPTPRARVLGDVKELYDLDDIEYPLFVKGVYYGAEQARSVDEAVQAYHRVVVKWGLPVMVQEKITGEEIDVAGVGDGEGGLLGAVAMRKTFLTDKGKGWAGVAIKAPELIELVERFVAATKWRGPFEFEAVREDDGGHSLLEINPRFPAWIVLSAGASLNLPWMVARRAAGEPVDAARDYDVGKMFIRISIDQIVDLESFQQIATHGERITTREDQ